MASNRELIAEAKTLGEELGVEVETRGLNNKGLTELVNELKARREGVPGEQPAPVSDVPSGPDELGGEPPEELPLEQPPELPPTVPPPAPLPEPVAAPAPPAPPPRGPHALRYLVAPGKALTSPRGVLGPGAEIRETDVADGVKQLDLLIERGFVVVQ